MGNSDKGQHKPGNPRREAKRLAPCLGKKVVRQQDFNLTIRPPPIFFFLNCGLLTSLYSFDLAFFVLDRKSVV